MTKEASIYQFDSVEVRPASWEVFRGGKAVPLEPKAVRVLLCLIERRERVVTKDELIQTVWEGAAVTDNALTRVIAQLRRELGDDAHQGRYIQTLPTVGYRFVGDLKVVPPRQDAPRRRWKTVLAAAIALGGVAWWAGRREGPKPAEEAQPVQLTTSPGLDGGGSFSPDGKSMVYSSNRSGWFQLYIRPVSPSGRERQITADSQQNIEPAWSPDGAWIAYHQVAGRGIWLAPAAGGTPRRVSAFGSGPVWSPDGRRIAFRSQEPISFALFDLAGIGDSTLWTVAPDGSELRQITMPGNPAGQHANPSWSPDGQRIVFASLAPANSTLWTLELASGELKPFGPANAGPRWAPVYAPDGQSVYFAAMRSLASGVTICRSPVSGGGEPETVYRAGQEAPFSIAISPDGARLAYTRATISSQIWVTGAEGPRPIYEDAVVRAKIPAYSPDGKRLACVARRAGSSQDLWVMNADGSGAAAVAADPGEESSPGWSADGTAILYSYAERGRFQLRRLGLADGRREVLLETKAMLLRPHITADGREVTYEAGRPENIWALQLKGGAPRQLTFDREGARFNTPSPDGNWIAYEMMRGDTTEIGLMGRHGGQPQQVTSGGGHNWPNSWSSDNRRIAYAGYSNGVWNIWWIDRVTRERKQLTGYTAFGSFARNPAWRPGSEQIAYEYSVVKGNIYMLNVAGAK